MENKILIVDDAIFMRMIIKEALSKSGYNNLIEANDGEEACNIFKYEKPDLMLLDITMPKKDGLEVLREIKKLDSSAKVVMCSAIGQENMIVEAIKLGALDFIVKPFKTETLVKVVNNVLK
ncbi:TPA: response regulator [Clostridioides difficile]|uniref:Stage 0 sporulation protein A homolog n=4 Tax=Clostridioides difficile TaxID=1496 RepID=A0A069A6C1_CLODI|nr:response regulator [Clostridioides difficile]OFU00492.1 two-component system response regulator [Clostridium sp. HMSC19E03]OFU12175.1 two-component system response regulator [Clostridium sp. HMSC19C09]OFU21169.1 two-component system response regulator [Clostridium sp. HMSC19C08]OFU24138.1 two-component system response regulator [Clostridium sp. HMSC19C05]OFU26033.1 two-component system response regulator [Clostridium sp. HMSC19B12]OFU36626.1 two-component system response regulator [Clostri